MNDFNLTITSRNENFWEQRKLEKLSEHKGGTSIEKYFSSDGLYKVISIGSYGLNNEYIDQGIRAVKNKTTESKLVRSGQLTMVLNDKTANGNLIGRCLLISKDNEFIVNQRTEIIIPGPDLNENYAYYYLNGPFRNKVKKIAQGGTQIYVNYSSVKRQKINYPIKNEQIKISKLLKIIKSLITLYERKTKLIKQIQSSFLDKFFFEPNNVTSLNHFLRIRNGYAFKSSELTENGEIPVVKISNIGNDKSFAFTTKEKNKEQFALYPNDIVIALSGATAGKINQVSNKYPIYYQNQRVGFFERKNDKLDYEYLNSFLHSKKFKSQLQKTLVAGAQPNIAPKDIEKIKIPFIGYKLQQKIGQVNKYLFELQRINKSKLTLLDKIKKTLLNNMFV